jgi:hypothetical protein
MPEVKFSTADDLADPEVRIAAPGSHRPLVTFDDKGIARHSRYREFGVATGRSFTMTYAGIDVVPEDVFLRREEVFRRDLAKSNDPGAVRDSFGDETVWEGNRLVGVIRFYLDGSKTGWTVVYRFDNPSTRRPHAWFSSKHSEAIGRTRLIKHGELIGVRDEDDETDGDD